MPEFFQYIGDRCHYRIRKYEIIEISEKWMGKRQDHIYPGEKYICAIKDVKWRIGAIVAVYDGRLKVIRKVNDELEERFETDDLIRDLINHLKDNYSREGGGDKFTNLVNSEKTIDKFNL